MKTKSVQIKKCSKCEEVKSADEFNKDKKYADGLFCWCKGCMKEYKKTYDKQYYQATKEKHKSNYQRWYKDNQQRRKDYKKKWYKENRERVLEGAREYVAANRERIRKQQTIRNQNPVMRLRNAVSHAVYSAITRNKGGKDGESVLQYLPYTIEQLKEHLEKQFEPWMTWENYGEWHLDHVYPQSKLLYDSMEHPNFQKCWAIENLQPLEAKENIRKGDKVIND